MGEQARSKRVAGLVAALVLLALAVLGPHVPVRALNSKVATSKPKVTKPKPRAIKLGPRTVTVGTGDLVEASGCAVPVNDPKTVWLHNDSGNAPMLFAFDLSSGKLRSVPVANATLVDWEDIAPLPGGGVVVGDIGDNDSTRESVQLYRIGDLASNPLTAVRQDLRYEDGPHNAEALVVDPRSPAASPDIFVITKDPTGHSMVYQAAGGVLKNVASVAILGEALIFPNQITAADALPDGSGVILRTYQYAYVYRKLATQPFVSAFASKPVQVSMPYLAQAEALCVLSDGSTAMTTTESRGSATIPFFFFPIP